MELEKMYYTRSKNGKLGLCKSGKMTPEEYVKTYKNRYNVKKARYNILDLIEVGDYVNGSKVELITDYNEKYLGYKIGSCYLRLGTFEIKTIVTKEQFESMSYKVDDAK